MDCISGITYYGLESQYVGDVTKYCGLSANEIDCNFNFLRGKEIKDFYWIEEESLFVIELLDGTQIKTDSVEQYINASIEAILSGITKAIEEIDCELSGLSESVQAIYDDIDIRFSGMTEDMDAFKSYIDGELQENYDALIAVYNDGMGRISDRMNYLEDSLSGVTNSMEYLRADLISRMYQLEINTSNMIGSLSSRIEQYNNNLNDRIDQETATIDGRLDNIEFHMDDVDNSIANLQGGLNEANMYIQQLSGATESGIDALNDRIDDAMSDISTLNTALLITGGDVETF